MKIVITGGAGFIGSHIADALIEKFAVVVLDNLSTGSIENIKRLQNKHNFKFLNVDIRDKETLSHIFEILKPDYVFHLAAQMNVRHSVSNPQNDADINIIGLLNILEACRKNNVKKIIFSSSGGAMYGDNVKLPTLETEKEFPSSPYGISKLCSEKYLAFYKKQYGLDYISLRYSNVYGPRQNPKGEAGAISIFISKMLDGEQPFINGSGNQTRDYVYVSDIVNANLLALKNFGGIFNIGTGKETSVNEIFRKIKFLINSDCKEEHNPALLGEQQRSCLSFEKIKKACNWQPQINLDEGLKKTIEWFKENRITKETL